MPTNGSWLILSMALFQSSFYALFLHNSPFNILKIFVYFLVVVKAVSMLLKAKDLDIENE
jgi:hypothetical protein